MKEEEVDGKKIINALIANSESWNKRTKFSQAKFIKMKREKYLINFETRMPNAEELVEVYSSFAP
jgi:tRNA (adenine-N(1)-)-methyltransferase non-catalytic subunit